MEDAQFLEIAEAIMTHPTAPFHEDAVRSDVERRLAELPHVSVERDGFGNLIARYQRGGVSPRLAFVAHMDHPGYVGEQFLGGVPDVYLRKNPATRSFGPFSMWDLPAFDVRDGVLYSRACDDLVSVAAMVAMLGEL